MQISRIVGRLDTTKLWNRQELLVLGGCGYMSASKQLGFFERFLCPASCHNIAANLAAGDEVHRDHSELCACSALNEQYLIALRITEQ
ncbi:hypothetical protein D3C80_1718350 [compost metagenome]